MADNVHRAVRKRIKQKLAKMDLDDPDELTLLDIEADCKAMGLEDHGSKIYWEFDDCEDEEIKDKYRRK